MNRGEQLLQVFLSEMRQQASRIKKGSYANDVTLSRSAGGVDVVVVWKNKNGTEGRWTKTFTLEELLGDTMRQPPTAWRIQRRFCAYAREVLGSVLNQRGV